MLDSALAAAFIDGPVGLRLGPFFLPGHRCLGVRLRPFSLWHRFLLKTLDSPIFNKGELSLPQLRDAVGVCRLLPFQTRLRKPTPGLFYIRHGLQAEADRFYAYCGDYITKPDWVVVPPPRPKDAAPLEHRTAPPDDMQIVGDIIAWSHWPEKMVWALPIGRAYWYQMIAQRALGADVDFVDQGDREFQEEMRRGGDVEKRRGLAMKVFETALRRVEIRHNGNGST